MCARHAPKMAEMGYCASALEEERETRELTEKKKIFSFFENFVLPPVLCCAKSRGLAPPIHAGTNGIRWAPAANDRLRSKSRPDWWLTSFRQMEEKAKEGRRRRRRLFYFVFLLFFHIFSLLFLVWFYSREKVAPDIDDNTRPRKEKEKGDERREKR